MKRVSIGGQAVLEGIMMKGPDSYSLAVRKEDGEIALEVHPYRSFAEDKHLQGVPIVRGVVNFIESLYIGMKTLMASSEYYIDEDEEEGKDSDNKPDKKTEAEPERDPKEKKEEGKGYLMVSLLISLAFAIGVFILLPSFVANLLYKVTDSHLMVNLCEGVLRLIIFLGYVAIISQMKDIKRTFMYHGAEHKTINCLEAGVELTPENVLRHTRFHKRCGTSFVFIVMIISILVFMFVRTDTLWLRLLSRLLLIPVVAGMSYEVLRYAGRHDNLLSRILSTPGLWVQRLTTREPDASMAEVAIKAVDSVIDWRTYIDCVNHDSFEK